MADMEPITSLSNARVKALASLQQRKFRQAEGLTLAEGLHLVVDAFSAGVSIGSLIVAERAAVLPVVHKLEEDARSRGIEIVRLSDACYEKISELQSPEGVAVTIRTGNDTLESLLVDDARLLVAAGVQDPGNAGALVRTAEAAGATGCVFLGGVDISHPRFVRGAQSSSFRLPCVGAEEEDFIAGLARTSIRLVVADAGPGGDYKSADYTPPVAIVVGGEGQGIPQTLMARAQARISIPMKPPVESLNVAVAAGVLLYEARRHWTK